LQRNKIAVQIADQPNAPVIISVHVARPIREAE
jgi:hypothetical protein